MILDAILSSDDTAQDSDHATAQAEVYAHLEISDQAQRLISAMRQWRKLHIGVDAKTLQIRAVQLTTNNVSDPQVLEDLLAQISLDEKIDSVYTDGAYDTKHCRQVILDRDAHAIIPPRKNAKPWKDQQASSIARNELLKTVKQQGRSLWKKWSGYHCRSLVETKMHCIKSYEAVLLR